MRKWYLRLGGSAQRVLRFGLVNCIIGYNEISSLISMNIRAHQVFGLMRFWISEVPLYYMYHFNKFF